MGTYKGLQGYRVESLASDPGTISEVIGKLWYNSASNVWKIGKEGSGTWASSTALPTANLGSLGFGSSTAAIMASGQGAPPSYTIPTTSTTWNGTAWAEDAAINQARYVGAGCGASSTSGIIIAGFHSPPSSAQTWNEEFDGTSWTALAVLNTGRLGNGGAGIVTASITMGGATGPGESVTATTETWNGTAWTEVNDLNTARYHLGSASQGTTTAAMAFGGLTKGGPGSAWGVDRDETEQYNGTSWTEVNNLNTARGHVGNAGNQAGALCYGGNSGTYPGQISETETWNGTSWTEVSDLSGDKRDFCDSNGSSTAALGIGCATPPGATWSATVEIWDGAPAGVQTVTTS